MRRAAWVLVWAAVCGLQVAAFPSASADLIGSSPASAPASTAEDVGDAALASVRKTDLTLEETAYFAAHPEAVQLAAAYDPVPIEGYWWETALGVVALAAVGVTLWIFLVRNDRNPH